MVLFLDLFDVLFPLLLEFLQRDIFLVNKDAIDIGLLNLSFFRVFKLNSMLFEDGLRKANELGSGLSLAHAFEVVPSIPLLTVYEVEKARSLTLHVSESSLRR